MANKVIIAGASGLVGSAAVRLFASRRDWEVVAVSRRPPRGVPGSVQHLSVDLCDEQACARAFGSMADVTHLIYAAVSENPDDVFGGWSDPAQVAKNAAMLRNLFEPLGSTSRHLRHVALVHGAKAYGPHLPQVKVPVPMRECLPRVPYPNFYYDQEDYLRARQRGQSWSWTVLRPVMIGGVSTGSTLNSFLVLPLFAALCKEAGLDLPLPDGVGIVADAADADLIAEALEWAAESPAARNEIFNVANGDAFALHGGFPVVAECFGLSLGEPRRFDIVAEIRRMDGLWRDMVRRYHLKAPEDVETLFGGSMQMGGSWSAEAPEGNPLRWGLVSTIKIRQAGFDRCVDSLKMIQKYARRYQELGILPLRTD